MKIKVKCLVCKKVLLRSPSKVEPRNYCSLECYAKTRNKELVKFGYKFPKGHRKNKPEHYKNLAKLLKDNGHPSWKGEKVSYRGLHQWVRRNKGKPTTCSECGKQSEKPRVIQWANTDGKYRRVLDDFIALCASCHKFKDLAIKSIRGGRVAK